MSTSPDTPGSFRAAPDSSGLIERCGAVVLAAGEARRFGCPKLLMPFGPSTILGSVVGTLIAADIAPIIVVVGAGAPAIEAALSDYPAQFVCNPEPARGMVSSIRVGVAVLPVSLNRFLVALGDQPRITGEGITHLLRQHARSGKGIALPTYHGKRGHPVLFDSAYRRAILDLTDDQTLRDLIHAHADDCVEVACDSDAYVRDIDTQEQYEDELRRSRADP